MFLKEFFEKVNFEKSAYDNNSMENYPASKEIKLCSLSMADLEGVQGVWLSPLNLILYGYFESCNRISRSTNRAQQHNFESLIILYVPLLVNKPADQVLLSSYFQIVYTNSSNLMN